MNGIIGIDGARMREKIEELKQVQNNLQAHCEQPAYVFGDGKAQSRGRAAEEMDGLDSRYREAGRRLNTLMESTIQYLQATLGAFEETDGAVAKGMNQKGKPERGAPHGDAKPKP